MGHQYPADAKLRSRLARTKRDFSLLTCGVSKVTTRFLPSSPEPCLMIPSHFRSRKPAIVMAGSGQTITFGELEDYSNQFAHLMRSLGLSRGDTIHCASIHCCPSGCKQFVQPGHVVVVHGFIELRQLLTVKSIGMCVPASVHASL